MPRRFETPACRISWPVYAENALPDYAENVPGPLACLCRKQSGLITPEGDNSISHGRRQLCHVRALVSQTARPLVQWPRGGCGP